MRNKKGFTLAEVLVTLAVIGVVAALTIPTLMSSTSQRTAETSVKKALSVLNQALSMSIANDSVQASAQTSSVFLKDLFAAQMSVLKDDDTNSGFISADGMEFRFQRSDTCNTVSDGGADSANCIVEVDINGNSGSSTVSTGTTYSDLYYFIIQPSSVIPANGDGAGASWTVADAGSSNFKGDTGTVDDIALDILLGN